MADVVLTAKTAGISATNKARVAANSLFTRSNSETWFFWGSIALSILFSVFPSFHAVANDWAVTWIKLPADAIVGGWIAIYAGPRVWSKVLKSNV